MITYVNSSNTIRYSALFEKATLALKDANIITDDSMAITSLEEYFAYIKELSSLKDDQGNPIGRRYTILPIDEETFDINADTRQITVPPSFKKNGIAVKGDEVAEVLYFKIDRFFDATDFNNMEIYIQWETAPDSKGVTNKGVSREWVRDIESEPGKIIFGWPLSSSITENAGNIKFAVRFFQWRDEEKAATGTDKTIDYSFSTLTASVSIQAGLNFNLEASETPDDCGNRLIERLENSEIAGGYAAATPIFEKNLDVPNANLIYDLDPNTHILDLLVQAYATDTGAITYTWKKQGLNEDNTVEGQNIDTFPGTNVFTKVDDLTKLNKSYAYYWTTGSDANGNKIYTRYDRFTANADGTITPDIEDSKIEGFALYVKQSQFTADSAGVYWAVAENRITNSSSAELSKKAIFPRPEDIVISVNPTAKAILLDEDTDGDYEVVLTAGASNTDGVLTYQWEKDPNYALNFGGKEPAYEEIEGATGNTFKATEPGHYRAVITNTRNLAHKYATTEKSRVTYTAKMPIILEEDLNAKFFQVSALTDDNCPTIRLDETVESDGYTVSWFLNEGTVHHVIVEDEAIPVGTFSASFNPKNYADKIKEVSAENPDIDGAYFALVTNHVNGSTKETLKPEYADMFKVTY